MKKLVLMFAVAFSMSFVACGNKEAAAEAEAAADSTTVAVVEETVVADATCANCDTCKCDTCACDTVVAVAAEVVEAAAN